MAFFLTSHVFMIQYSTTAAKTECIISLHHERIPFSKSDKTNDLYAIAMLKNVQFKNNYACYKIMTEAKILKAWLKSESDPISLARGHDIAQ